MAEIEELYQEIILEHNKRPRNFGPLAGATHMADGLNPLCGDELKIALQLEEGRIAALRFEGQGCAISKASASMMSEAVDGKSVEEARQIADKVLGAFQPGGTELVLEEDGEIAALLGVRKFPARIKCATLAWHALVCALEGKRAVSTEN
ncbi:MAG: Fe-S cluster assembly sulfur transfer protein SufU [Puniceicoccaceae bacterium]